MFKPPFLYLPFAFKQSEYLHWLSVAQAHMRFLRDMDAAVVAHGNEYPIHFYHRDWSLEAMQICILAIRPQWPLVALSPTDILQPLPDGLNDFIGPIRRHLERPSDWQASVNRYRTREEFLYHRLLRLVVWFKRMCTLEDAPTQLSAWLDGPRAHPDNYLDMHYLDSMIVGSIDNPPHDATELFDVMSGWAEVSCNRLQTISWSNTHETMDVETPAAPPFSPLDPLSAVGAAMDITLYTPGATWGS